MTQNNKSTSTFYEILSTHPDLLILQDCKNQILEQIEARHSSQNTLSLVSSTEKSYGVQLRCFREEIAMQDYNNNPKYFANFERLIPFMEIAQSEEAQLDLREFFLNIQDKEQFNLQILSLRYGHPKAYSILIDAIKTLNKQSAAMTKYLQFAITNKLNVKFEKSFEKSL